MITSVSNAKIKNVMQLNQKAKARREQGLFVAEGRKMFLEAPENWVSQVFVSETFSKDGELMSQVEKYPYEIVKDSVFRQMCDTKSPGDPYRSETAFLERGRSTGRRISSGHGS